MAEPLTVTTEKVIEELCSEPLGRALWERAQWKVVAHAQAERIAELENRTAPIEPPSQGWDVPSDG
jgi:hypothetical protein